MSTRRRGRPAPARSRSRPEVPAQPSAPKTPPNSVAEQMKEDRRRQRLVETAARRRRVRLVRWGTWTAATLVVAAVIGLAYWRASRTPAGTGGLPGPRGGPSVAQDVTSLIGKPASAFTLTDSDGKSYTITPGRGRSLVLISHMGIT